MHEWLGRLDLVIVVAVVAVCSMSRGERSGSLAAPHGCSVIKAMQVVIDANEKQLQTQLDAYCYVLLNQNTPYVQKEAYTYVRIAHSSIRSYVLWLQSIQSTCIVTNCIVLTVRNCSSIQE